MNDKELAEAFKKQFPKSPYLPSDRWFRGETYTLGTYTSKPFELPVPTRLRFLKALGLTQDAK